MRGSIGPILATLVVLLSLAQAALGQAPDENPARDGKTFVAAFGGVARTGSWNAVRTGGTDAVSIRTRDGNDLEIHYPVNRDAEWTYWKVGPASAPVEIWNDEKMIGRVELDPQDYAATTIVGLGTDASISDVHSDIVTGATKHESVTVVTDPALIPDRDLGWEGIDLVILSLAERDLLKSLSRAQAQGLIDWVQRGGRIFLLGGPQTRVAIEESPWLRALFPPDSKFGEAITLDTASIETYAASLVRLDPVMATPLPAGGRVVLQGSSIDRAPVRVVVEYLTGFGRVTAVGVDWEGASITAWQGRNRFLRRLLPEFLEVADSGPRRTAKSNLGYRDLAGQMRATLDRPNGFRTPFSWLAGLLLAFLALVGPVDYWLINRLMGRPLLGWITFPVMVLGISGLMVAWQHSQQPGRPLVRQIEVMDLIPALQQSRAFSWAHMEIANPQQYDLSFRTVNPPLGKGGEPVETMWQGVAGEDFGGLKAVGALPNLPPYEVRWLDVDAREVTQLRGVPIAAAGSVGLEVRWTLPSEAWETLIANDVSSLRQSPGSETLTGKIVNPLQVDLLEPVLLYRNSVYLLPTRLPARGVVPQVEKLAQKNLSWRLTRRKLREGNSESSPWDPGVIDQMSRTFEMLLLHGAAGGSTYTGLQHRPLARLDLSHVLTQDRAVLMGRVSDPLTEMTDSAGEPVGDVQERLAYCRIVFPVAPTTPSP